jgi:hypothetical protein
VAGFVIFEWMQRSKEHAFEVERLPQPLRWSLYWAVGFTTLALFRRENSFIYFQF